MSSTPFPNSFCWTRFGTEAGESIEEIIHRKELERRANGGIFLWGIGNALGPSMRELVRDHFEPEVLFSPIRSRPKVVDVSPAALVKWESGATLSGRIAKVPSGSLVVSRTEFDRPKTRHYALVCKSTEPLQLRCSNETLKLKMLQNYISGRKIGMSQVTAIVKRATKSLSRSKTTYPVSLRAVLTEPYFLELRDPEPYFPARI